MCVAAQQQQQINKVIWDFVEGHARIGNMTAAIVALDDRSKVKKLAALK